MARLTAWVRGGLAGSVLAVVTGTPLSVLAADSVGQDSLFDRLDLNRDGVVTSEEVPAEHQRLLTRLLRLGDADQNGRLSKAELAATLASSAPDKPIATAKPGEAPGAKHARLLLLRLDATGDQTLTRDEAPAELHEVFDRVAARADLNDDGRITRFELNRTGPQLIEIARKAGKRLGWDVDAELQRLRLEQGEAANRFDTPMGPLEALSDPRLARELFRRLDADGNNKLTIDEAPEPARDRLRRLFARADKNRDNVLTRKEYLDAARQLPKRNRLKKTDDAVNPSRTMATKAKTLPKDNSLAEHFVRRLISQADKNGDGVVTRDEATERFRQRFDAVDRNRNGQLEKQEINAAIQRLDLRLRKARDRASASPGHDGDSSESENASGTK